MIKKDTCEIYCYDEEIQVILTLESREKHKKKSYLPYFSLKIK